MNALVVGHGRMGRFHARALRDLGLEVETVDPCGGADHWWVPKDRSFDVVCIAAPIDSLAAEAMRWVGHTGWLLIEKPMAPNLADAISLASMFEAAGQRVAVGYVERFNPEVRRLRDRLRMAAPVAGRFTRWSDRPTDNPDLDLRTHDLDLVRFLNIPTATFDVRTGCRKARLIEVDTTCGTLRADLLAHDTSPLHAQWAAFLAGSSLVATPDDAVAALARLEAAPRRLTHPDDVEPLSPECFIPERRAMR